MILFLDTFHLKVLLQTIMLRLQSEDLYHLFETREYGVQKHHIYPMQIASTWSLFFFCNTEQFWSLCKAQTSSLNLEPGFRNRLTAELYPWSSWNLACKGLEKLFIYLEGCFAKSSGIEWVIMRNIVKNQRWLSETFFSRSFTNLFFRRMDQNPHPRSKRQE